jgi:hypothetical protein
LAKGPEPAITRSPQPFEQSRPWSLHISNERKCIVQGGAFYSYAEAKGKVDPRTGSRALEPVPQFIAWEDEEVAKDRREKIKELRKKVSGLMEEINDLEKVDKELSRGTPN